MIKVLLDENLPRKLKWFLDAEAITVPEHGWGGIKNGRLLWLAAQEFDVLLTMDKEGDRTSTEYGGVGVVHNSTFIFKQRHRRSPSSGTFNQ